MAVNPIVKIRVIAHGSVRASLVDLLQRHGCVEIKELENDGDGPPVRQRSAETMVSPEITDILAELDYLLGFLSPFVEHEKLMARLSRGKNVVTRQKIKEILDTYHRQKVYEETKSIARKLSDNTKRVNELKTRIQSLVPWLPLDTPLEELKSTRETEIVPLAVPTDTRDALNEEIRKELRCLQKYVVSESETGEHMVLMTTAGEKETLDAILTRVGLERKGFPGLTGTPAEATKSAREEITKIEADQGELREKTERLARFYREIQVLHDFYSNEKEKFQVQRLFGDTRETFFLEGWVCARDTKRLKTTLERNLKDISVGFVQPGKNEQPPVALKNSPLITPFEGLTKLYGLPKNDEADPTPFLAPFFFLFFGLCLTDAGYGLVLTLLALYALKKFSLEPNTRNMVKLALFCGISTIIAGAITGGWFGDLAEWTGWEALILAKNSLVIFDPIKQPMVFFVLSLSLGYIQVVFGIVVEFWDLWRHGRQEEAIFDQLPWLVFFAGLALMIPASLDPTVFPVEHLAKGCIGGGLLALLLFGGRPHRNPLKRIGLGLLKLYSLIGYFSDILSYSRLLALGLATGAVANVINKIAFIAMDVPVVGYFLVAIILVGGHTYNMVINFLGAAIHSLRLQFVEFFPKFFEGGGRIFTPFRSVERYSVVREQGAGGRI